MIVDCHTHIWQSPTQVGLDRVGGRLARTDTDGQATPQQHHQASQPADLTLVLGFKSHYLGTEVPDTFLADYVRQHPDRLIGFGGVDPTDLPKALDQMRQGCTELGLKGVTLSPAAQFMHPADTRALRLYAEASRMGLPIIFDADVHRMTAGRMEFAQPMLLDEVAHQFPQLRIVVSHMGYPWVEQTVVLLGKHAHVLADVSGLLHQPWQAYNALLSAYHHGVIDKLLFGSDFPYGSATSAIETLYSLNQISHGTNLPSIPRSLLRGIVERNAPALLGIAAPSDAPAPVEPESVVRNERV